MKTSLRTAMMLAAVASPATANEISFDDWTHQPFSIFSNNDYHREGPRLDVVSDDSVSLIYTMLEPDSWNMRTARWSWRVEESAPATDLARKGADDRNLSIYAVFLPPGDAERLRGESVAAILDEPSALTLTYIWGGDYDRDALVASPYLGERGIAVMLRPAGVGEYMEQVDLAEDLKRAFGAEGLALVGLAVSADSDDTDSRIRASVSGLVLE
ncbi:MAG: DUF3047 domain-containing protein [Pikeienuella sp.]|uniref:DUF3047 domain-containing protein n=1 Tax=Pikeienuella sp. TaxID=2831957 RepID=UPI003918AB14